MNPTSSSITSTLHPHPSADNEPVHTEQPGPAHCFALSGSPLPPSRMTPGQGQALLRNTLNAALLHQSGQHNFSGLEPLITALPDLLQDADALHELTEPPLNTLLDNVNTQIQKQLAESTVGQRPQLHQLASDVNTLRQAAHFAGHGQWAGLPEGGILLKLHLLRELDPATFPQVKSSQGLRQFLHSASEACRGLIDQLNRPLDLAKPLVGDDTIPPMLRQVSDLLAAIVPQLTDADGRESAKDLQQTVAELHDHLLQRAASEGDVYVDAPEGAEQADGAMQKLTHALRQTSQRTDVHAALSQRDDAEFKSQLRGEYAEQIKTMITHAEGLDAILTDAKLPKAAEKSLRSANNDIISELNALSKGVPLTERAWRGALTLAAYPLPLAVSLVTHEKEYSSTLIPHFVKNLALLTGLMTNDSTNHQSVLQHANNRLFVNGVVGLIYAGPAFINAMKPLHGAPAFSVGAGLLSGAATFGWFNQKQLGKGVNHIIQKMQSLVFGSRNDQLILRSDAKARLHDYIEGLQGNRQAFAEIDRAFRGGGEKHLSDNLDAQIERTLTQMDSVLQEGHDLLTRNTPDERNNRTETAAPPHNADFLPKLGLTAFTGMICGGVVALMSDNPVGMVDYIVDGLWCSHEMYKQAANPNVNLQGAVKTFKDLVGLNLTMIAYLSANKGYDFLHAGAGEYAAGTLAMTAANLTLPGMVGEMVGNSAGGILEKGNAAFSHASREVQGALGYLTSRLNSSFGITEPERRGTDIEMQPAQVAAMEPEAQSVSRS